MGGDILFVFSAADGTGSMKMMATFARASMAAGLRVHLVTASELPSGKPLPAAGEELLSALASDGVSVVRVGAALLNRVGWTLAVRRVLRQVGPSIAVAFLKRDRGPVVLAAAGLPAKVVLSIQNRHVFFGSQLEQALKRRVYGLALGHADLLIASSPAVAAELAMMFDSVPTPTVTIPNSVDVRGSVSVAVPAMADGEMRLVSVGRLDPQKGYGVLIAAVEGLRVPMQIRIAGNASAGSIGDDYVEEIRSAVASLRGPATIELLGWRDDIPALLADCHLYVHPALWEGWPLAVLEAMAAGRAVIMTDCVGRPPGFEDGVHGWVVRAGNSSELARALEAAASATLQDLQLMGERARELALAYYDNQETGRRFSEALMELAEGDELGT